jgi:large subunit ribosomal protein L18
MAKSKRELGIRRHWRVRKKIIGTPERPRLSVRFSGRHIHVQFIDDMNGVTLAAFSSTQPDLRQSKLKPNMAGAALAGKMAAERAISKKIKNVVFDRGSRKYHGKVKALADAAREAGLQF